MTSNVPQPNDPNYYNVGSPPQAPAYGPPTAPPKKKSKTLWIVIGVVGAVLLLCCGIAAIVAAMGDPADKNPSADSTNGTTQPKQEKDQPDAAAKIGSAVRDGKFEFTVKSVKCGESKVGSEFLSKTAQGQFCVVNVQVKNIGNEARTFDSSNQRAFGVGDVKYSSDGVASLYANENNESFINEINPGNSIAANVVFDIPKDGKLLVVELHDSAFSGGVKVSLT